MAAWACLRIFLQPARLDRPGSDVLTAAARFTAAQLEACWPFPKHVEQTSTNTFMLSDPYAGAIPPDFLQPIAGALQRQLFGVGDTGEATLILFAGAKEELDRLAQLSNPEMRLLVDGQLGDLHGLLRCAVYRVDNRKIEFLRRPAVEPAAAVAPPPLTPVFRGVFVAPKQEFVGSIASRWTPDDTRYLSIFDGDTHFPAMQDFARFDEETARAALGALPAGAAPPGILYLPVNYTNLTKPGPRADFWRMLSSLEAWPRPNIAAMLYDVPRDPFYSTIGDVTNFLAERFSAVDLLITDPGFNVGSLSHAKVRTIALSLPNAEDALRQSALRRFAAQRDALRTRQILSMAMNVRSAAEIAQCVNLKIPLISGKAVSDALSRPLGAFPYIVEGLPLMEIL
jgi:hypothetical protein